MVSSRTIIVTALAGLGLLFGIGNSVQTAEPRPTGVAAQFSDTARPIIQKYCLGCHSTKLKKGSLDLEQFTSAADVCKNLKAWQQVVELLDAGEMPPKDKPQPTAAEKTALTGWVRGFLDEEARARAGDPGHVPLRRLSNAEYDATILALTGVDLRPTREFPADGAAGEGFTNAAEALTDISPALLTKYLNAAKEIAEHAVLLPDGFRFSAGKTRRDWTNESVAQLRKEYVDFAPDGRLPLERYLSATVRHRDAVIAGKTTIAEIAANEKLNAKYLRVLWQALTDPAFSYPLDAIRTRWKTATEPTVPALVAEIAAWQAAVWQVVPIGSYRYGNSVRDVANDPAAAEAQPVKLTVKPAPGQSEIVVYLSARDTFPTKPGDSVIWRRPRFERTGSPPLLLRDLPQYGPSYEIDYPTVFKDTAKYLAAAADGQSLSPDGIAVKHGLDAELLKHWLRLLAIEPRSTETPDPAAIGQSVPAGALKLLDEPTPKNEAFPAINGWRKKGTDLPVLLGNASDKVEQIPGRVTGHGIAVHPLPAEFVAAVWKSPMAGNVRVALHVAHAHPSCGNGVAWWLEHRRADKAAVLAGGTIDLGKEVKPPAQTWKVEQGDLFVLAVDARNGDHSCDLTDISFTMTEIADPGRLWDLERDVADTVQAGNPHADRLGNEAVWSFVRGPTRPTGTGATFAIPPDSVLGQWRTAIADPQRREEAGKLADRVQTLLSGSRPKDEGPDRVVYDNLVSVDSVLIRGLETHRVQPPEVKKPDYGLENLHFTDDASLIVSANFVTRLRLPAGLFADRQFVAEGTVESNSGDRVVQFQVSTSLPNAAARWDGKSPVVASATGDGYKRLMQGYADSRRVFPQFVCFPAVIPTDEAVSLKMFHREDEPLIRLFLNDEQTRRLDNLWTLHRFISRQPVAENNYLPLFIGFVTQDQPKELLAYFEGQRPAFRKRAEDFEQEEAAAIPKQLDALVEFAARAYRRPVDEKEEADLIGLYRKLHDAKGLTHDEAFRGVLSRILAAPAFLFRIERALPGKDPGPVTDWELATRLSYFLWSAPPDQELRRMAAAGGLHEPTVLAAQTRRLLSSDSIRSLAIEFGTQWIHVRGFDELKEKDEKRFPQFDAALRRDIYEESIRFFQDLVQADRPVTDILDSDATFLNENMAKFYGMPNVTGPEWRRVEGVKKYGRGGILGLASVQARQAGAARTSPVLRGNWVVETLLGEKLPRPPANVPKLPEEEGGSAGLTMRQLVEKHAGVPECAVCHRRIDPFGFALEHYDPIGRRRDSEIGGSAIDAHASLKDGTEFDGLDGLRTYLLTKKKDVIVRLFCRRLLGYALGRAVVLSDQPLIDDMVAALNDHDGRLSAAILTIVRSPQFRMIRGADDAPATGDAP
jgi:hypothetical protein